MEERKASTHDMTAGVGRARRAPPRASP